MNKLSIAFISLLLAIAVGGGVLIYLRTQSPPNNPNLEPKEVAVSLENGLTKDERADFYHLAEGSEIYPVLWMQALKTNNGKYFLEDVERLGFLPDPDNKDGLPVDLTSGVTRGLEALGPMSGLNCAACHVGELHYNGKRVRIDGAPNLLNTREFFITVIDSALDTAKDPAKLTAFVTRIHELQDAKRSPATPAPVALGRKLLRAVVKKEEEAFDVLLKPVLGDIIQKEFASPRLSFKAALQDGVLDEQAFHAKIVQSLKLNDLTELAKKSIVLRELAEEVQKQAALRDMLNDIYVKLRLLRARAEFLKKLGMVGDDQRTDWGPGRVDAFGSARAFLFQDGYAPLNPVSYPPLFDLQSHDWFHYDNNTNTFLERNFGQALGVGAVWDAQSKSYSLQPKNLRTLEALARKLSAPAWPEAIFGKIDQDRAARGKVLYVKYCAECHDVPKEGKAFEKLDDPAQIKTDPARALMFAEKLPDGRLFYEAIRDTMATIKTKALDEFSKQEQEVIQKEAVDWRGPGKYSSRSIQGAWATAPYLHNGSVPTLDDLLKPADQRPKTFSVGSREYDVQKLGYAQNDKASIFDTTKPGNSNAGHEGEKYGTTILVEQRKDLIEYLKTR